MTSISGKTAVKRFDIEESVSRRGHTVILVKSRGRLVRRISRPTVYLALVALERAGFEPVAWVEGRKIILQDSAI